LDDKQITKYKNEKIETDIFPAARFYSAHAAHQMYLEKVPNGYCNHRIRFKWANMDLTKLN